MRNSKSTDLDKVTQWRAKKDLALHLQACMRENDPGLLAAELGGVACEKGLTQLSRDIGVRRTTLYRLLTIDADPNYSTVLKVARALGVKLYFEATPRAREGALNCIKSIPSAEPFDPKKAGRVVERCEEKSNMQEQSEWFGAVDAILLLKSMSRNVRTGPAPKPLTRV
jgi:probable addiction module antidote protein